MNVIVVCGRFPEHAMKGDQLRASQQIELLGAEHRVTVVTGGRPSSGAALADLKRHATVIQVPLGTRQRVLGALAAGLRGLPLQVGWMSPGLLWRATVASAAETEVALICTVRCLRARLPAPTVLDHIDALSENMRRRSRLERRWTLRAGAALEARLLRRHERRAAGWVAAQVVVSPLDARLLPQHPPPIVIPHVMPQVEDRAGVSERDIDVIVTGNMRYPPNRDAAQWLADEIVPRLRRVRGDVRVVVAGRGAAELGVTGVEVHADVPDLAPLLQRARVAVVPLRRGTGAPTKLLEAAAHGAAVVATPWTAESLGIQVDTAVDAEGFAEAIGRLLGDEQLRRERTEAAYAGIRARGPELVGRALNDVLMAVARG